MGAPSRRPSLARSSVAGALSSLIVAGALSSLIVAGALSSLTVAGPAAPALPPAGAPLTVHLEWARDARGAASLLDEIAGATIDALAERGCFGEVRPASSAEETEFRLDVWMDDLHEETLFDDSLAEQANPLRPDQAQRVTALFSVRVTWDLSSPDGRVVEGRPFRIERRRRPVMSGEDPALYARTEAVAAAGRELARAVCSAARKKLGVIAPAAPR